MRRTRRLFSIALFSLAVCSTALADEGSSGKNWFGLGGHKPRSANTTNTGASASSKASQAIASVAAAPKRLMAGTKSLFVSKKAQAPAKHSTVTRRSKPPKQPEPGFFQSLFGSTEPPPPKTVGDWMRLDPVRP